MEGSSDICCQGFRSDTRDGFAPQIGSSLLQISPIACLDLSGGLHTLSRPGFERVITTGSMRLLDTATRATCGLLLSVGMRTLSSAIQPVHDRTRKLGPLSKVFFLKLWSSQKTMSTDPPEKCRGNRGNSVGADSRAAKENLPASPHSADASPTRIPAEAGAASNV